MRKQTKRLIHPQTSGFIQNSSEFPSIYKWLKKNLQALISEFGPALDVNKYSRLA